MIIAIHHMTIPNNCLNILTAIRDSDNEAFLVGGCVRDSYMGITPKDFDICTNLLPEKVIELFSGKDYVQNLDLTGKSFGVVRIQTTDGEYEVATYRSETYDGKVRQPQTVEFKTNVQDDLARRDFTINALIYDFFFEEIRDYWGGLSDIQNRVIRCVGFPSERFKEDPLRILRAIRFHLKLNFYIEDTTKNAMLCSSLDIPKERIVEELRKIVSEAKSLFDVLQVFRLFGLVDKIIGEGKFIYWYSLISPNNIFKEPLIIFLLSIISTNLESHSRVLSLSTLKKKLSNLKFSNEEIDKVYLFLKIKYFLFQKENIVENVYKYKKEIRRVYGSSAEELEVFCETLKKDLTWFVSNKHPRWTERLCIYVKMPFVKADKYLEKGLSGIEIGKEVALDEQKIWRETRNHS